MFKKELFTIYNSFFNKNSIVIVLASSFKKNKKKGKIYVCPIFVLGKINGRLENSSNR